MCIIDFYNLLIEKEYRVSSAYQPAYPVQLDDQDIELAKGNGVFHFLPCGATEWAQNGISMPKYGWIAGNDIKVLKGPGSKTIAGEFKHKEGEIYYGYLPNNSESGALLGIMPSNKPFVCSSGALTGCMFCTISFSNAENAVCIHLGPKYTQEMKNRDLVVTIAIYLDLMDYLISVLANGWGGIENFKTASEMQMLRLIEQLLGYYGQTQNCQVRLAVYIRTDNDFRDRTVKLEPFNYSVNYYRVKGGVLFSGCNSKHLFPEISGEYYNDTYKTHILESQNGVDFSTKTSLAKIYTNLSFRRYQQV